MWLIYYINNFIIAESLFCLILFWWTVSFNHNTLRNVGIEADLWKLSCTWWLQIEEPWLLMSNNIGKHSDCNSRCDTAGTILLRVLSILHQVHHIHYFLRISKCSYELPVLFLFHRNARLRSLLRVIQLINSEPACSPGVILRPVLTLFPITSWFYPYIGVKLILMSEVDAAVWTC